MTRAEAWELLCEYTKGEHLRNHGLAVEAAMAWYAKKFAGEEEDWRVVGLLHDFDYERYPSMPDHPLKGAEILAERNLPAPLIRAIKSHVTGVGISRETMMEKTLFAVDELTGFIIAVALVRPSKRVADVTVKSVKKKMKDKAFARAVNRDEIVEGARELGIPLEDHVQNVIDALITIDEQLGV
ncbi:HDIG domain-containing protein [bacterium]|nr:HDIG domain-containing protein [candidate division CSSED10-310 bacterium]